MAEEAETASINGDKAVARANVRILFIDTELIITGSLTGGITSKEKRFTLVCGFFITTFLSSYDRTNS
jgi:hypothetical protein